MNLGLIDYALGIVVLGSLIGIYVFNKQQAVNPKAQMFSLLLLAVVIISGGALMWHSGMLSAVGIGSSSEERVSNASDQFFASQGFAIGQKIAEANPSGKVLVVVNPNDNEKLNGADRGRIGALIDALKKSGVGENFEVVAVEPSKSTGMPEEAAASVPFGMIVTAKDYNNVLSKTDAKAIFIISEMPNSMDEVRSISILKKKNNPVQIYFAANSINNSLAKELLKAKSIAGALQRKRGFRLGESAPSDLMQAFNESYVFIEP
ncbi:MAG: hypothetical protein PHI85_09820 [Victivallaceae bacterium]|nr:hypothetical protein [Victivallaceae bacterium]